MKQTKYNYVKPIYPEKYIFCTLLNYQKNASYLIWSSGKWQIPWNKVGKKYDVTIQAVPNVAWYEKRWAIWTDIFVLLFTMKLWWLKNSPIYFWIKMNDILSKEIEQCLGQNDINNAIKCIYSFLIYFFENWKLCNYENTIWNISLWQVK